VTRGKEGAVVRTRPVLFLAAALATLPFPVEGDDDGSFAELKASAARHASHGDGMRYDRHAQTYLASRHGPLLEACRKSIAQPDERDFELVILLASDGTVDKIIAQPETNLSSCLIAAAMTEDRLAPPPSPRYPVHVDTKVAP
jgi:hypothetical protein